MQRRENLTFCERDSGFVFSEAQREFLIYHKNIFREVLLSYAGNPVQPKISLLKLAVSPQSSLGSIFHQHTGMHLPDGKTSSVKNISLAIEGLEAIQNNLKQASESQAVTAQGVFRVGHSKEGDYESARKMRKANDINTEMEEITNSIFGL